MFVIQAKHPDNPDYTNNYIKNYAHSELVIPEGVEQLTLSTWWLPDASNLQFLIELGRWSADMNLDFDVKYCKAP